MDLVVRESFDALLVIDRFSEPYIYVSIDLDKHIFNIYISIYIYKYIYDCVETYMVPSLCFLEAHTPTTSRLKCEFSFVSKRPFEKCRSIHHQYHVCLPDHIYIMAYVYYVDRLTI
jgi:hypothetical protein